MRCNVHLALDGDIRICHRCGKELAHCTQEEGDSGRHFSTLLHVVLHLLKESVLKDRVHDQNESWENASEKSLGALIPEERKQCSQGGRRLGALAAIAGFDIGLLGLCARGDARVNHPDWVGDDDGRRSRNSASNHGLNGRELLVSPAGGGSSLLEESAGPFVPVIVYEVRDADAEERRVDARIETRNTLTGDDLLNGIDKLALGLFGFDLSSGRESDERIPREGSATRRKLVNIRKD